VTERRLSGDGHVPYDRSGPATIAHLGVGAFARAHLGTYADDLCRAGAPTLIRGVSLRSPRAEEQLGPQDGLYSLLVREPDVVAEPQVLGALTSVTTGPEAAVEAIADPAVALVTLTVTEKGYAPDQAPAVVAEGVRRRGPVPLVVASLDNVVDNGALLRERVLEAGAPAWVDDVVRFPSSVVDRMVPATTAADLDEVEQRLGVRDEAAVVAEAHRSWVLEEVDGLPPLGDVGVELVPDVGPYQRRKLWLLNGPHSALAYTGLLAGRETIADATADPVVAGFVDGLVADVVEVADVPDARAFSAEALRRFANPALGHTCRQVGTDGSQKLPQRLLPVVAARRERGLPTDRFAVVVALWQKALAERAVEDPATDIDLDPTFATEVAATRVELRRRGLDALRFRAANG